MKVLLDECLDWRLSRDIAVIVLGASSNRLADLQPLVPQLLTTIPTAERGVTTFIGV